MGGKKLALFNGEGADGEIDGGALLQKQQGFEKRKGVFTAGNAHGDTIALADHFEAADGFAHLAQNCLFEVHLITAYRPQG